MLWHGEIFCYNRSGHPSEGLHLVSSGCHLVTGCFELALDKGVGFGQRVLFLTRPGEIYLAERQGIAADAVGGYELKYVLDHD